VDRWSRQTAIGASITVQGERSLPLEVEQVLFRIAQEALANVARHSEAKGVQLTVSCAGEAAILEVTDDGHGFVPPSAVDRGMGLRSMRERVEALGGDLEVESTSGEGTRIRARCRIESTPEGGDSP
jgi:signal transduction histidine kinase